MKIRSVSYNNRKKGFEVKTYSKTLWFPYAKLEIRPSPKNRITAVYVDKELGRFVDGVSGPLRIAIASDHATLSETGQHAADPVPVLLWGKGIEADDVEAFDEQAVGDGALERFHLQLLLGRLFDLN